ncbi:Glycoside hydrolase, family 5 [Dillenia turbinata]|uniref:Glycoside hydrolase, family 5 n=1 Tax=Dillenia turbinata TaxID=194707 RepID=A0AAN8ZV07_9MAGN
MSAKTSHFILLNSLILFGTLCHSLPLSTSNRWIIDVASGNRVKLACVNWAAHMEAMVAEGLDKKPLKEIATKVALLGFNCVRLTWATFMFTRKQQASHTVAQSLHSLGLHKASIGMAKNNPSLLNLTLVEAYEAVVNELGANDLMVVLDNHVSRPMWCCRSNDGNGFFGDQHFSSEEWLQGLTEVAERFNGVRQVVAMSMRNELRGARQNVSQWYHYVQKGARSIHEANPEVLVIVSGLNYDTNLNFLQRRPLNLNLDNKLVYEAHWYSFSGKRREWEVQPLNQVCASAIQRFKNQAAFLITGQNPVPLFVSEFGVDQRGVNRADNRFLSCFLSFAAENDLDWALWALQGSYYLRNGRPGFDESYGVLDVDWNNLRNPKFQERFQLIQTMIQGMVHPFPHLIKINHAILTHYSTIFIGIDIRMGGSKNRFYPSSNASTYLMMYHPQSGRCVQVKGEDRIYLSSCQSGSRWSHEGEENPIRLIGSGLCLKVVGDGLPPILSTDCTSPQSTWKFVSSSKLHIAAPDEKSKMLCLESNFSNFSVIITGKCLCLEDTSTCNRDPQQQWFKLIPTNLQN